MRDGYRPTDQHYYNQILKVEAMDLTDINCLWLCGENNRQETATKFRLFHNPKRLKRNLTSSQYFLIFSDANTTSKLQRTKAVFYGSFENAALENEDRSTKHPNLENGAPKTRKQSTQISKPL